MILETLRSGRVTRFHGCPEVPAQNVDSHSWQVAVICVHLAEKCLIALRSELLMAALLHDCAELITGDIPFPVKQRKEVKDAIDKLEEAVEGKLVMNPNIKFLTPLEKDILKCADYLSGIYHTHTTTTSSEVKNVWKKALTDKVWSHKDLKGPVMGLMSDILRSRQ